jgi:hypothetical protein
MTEKTSQDSWVEFNAADKSYREAQSQSIGASVSFQEKLSAITAASLALAVTGAGALYKTPVANPSTTHWLLLTLIPAVVSLWLSLVVSIVHNYVESLALGEITEAQNCASLADMIRSLDDKRKTDRDEKIAWLNKAGNVAEARKLEEEQLTEMSKNQETAEQARKQAGPHTERAVRLRHRENRLSRIALSLFVLGYSWPIVYIYELARTFR